MEHRWGSRSSVNVTVTLQLASGRLTSGRIVNLSLSGALVRAETRVPAFSRVTVTLGRDNWAKESSQTIPAHVVREALGTVALEWSEFAPPAIRALKLEAAHALQTSRQSEEEICDVSAMPALNKHSKTSRPQGSSRCSGRSAAAPMANHPSAPVSSRKRTGISTA
jgi:hypothetical protein